MKTTKDACYFCNKPAVERRSDMGVQVCFEHDQTKFSTEPQIRLPDMEPHDPVYDEAVGKTIRMASANLNYSGAGGMSVQAGPNQWMKVPPEVYFWKSREGDICWRPSREAALAAIRAEYLTLSSA